MHFFKYLLRRIRFPLSLPEEIADDLGIVADPETSVPELIKALLKPNSRPSHLVKNMSREKAEAVFRSALIKERFMRSTICSYYFHEGWVEFILNFDKKSHLRRVYMQHKEVASDDDGCEIALSKRSRCR